MLKPNSLYTHMPPLRNCAYGHVTTWPSAFSIQKYSVLPTGMPLFGTHIAHTPVCMYTLFPTATMLGTRIPSPSDCISSPSAPQCIVGQDVMPPRHGIFLKKTSPSTTSGINTAGHKTLVLIHAIRGSPRCIPLFGV